MVSLVSFSALLFKGFSFWKETIVDEIFLARSWESGWNISCYEFRKWMKYFLLYMFLDEERRYNSEILATMSTRYATGFHWFKVFNCFSMNILRSWILRVVKGIVQIPWALYKYY